MSDEWEEVPDDDGWEEVPASEEEGSSVTNLSVSPALEGGARVGEAFGKFSEKASGGARELIRSIGTGEDAAEAYMRGFIHPKESLSLQEGAIQGANDAMTKIGVDKLPYAANVATRFAGGLIPSMSGMAVDITTNPAELLSIAAFERFPTLLKQVAPGIAQRIAEFATKERSVKSIGENIKGAFKPKPKMVEPNSADIQDMIKQVVPDAQEAAKVLAQNKAVEMADLRSKHAEINNGLDAKLKILDGDIESEAMNIPKAADKATTTIRNRYWDYAKDLSERFGKDYEKAIAGEKISSQSLYDALGNAIERDGFLKLPENQWSKSQKSIYEYQQKIKGLIQETYVQLDSITNQQVQVGSPSLKLAQVDKELNSILSSKKGKTYTSGDHILTIAREETANAIGQVSQKVKSVRMKFAPELQAKNELTKIVQPFNSSGEFDTTRGINFFSDYAKGKMSDPDQVRLLQVLEDNKKLGGDVLKPLDRLNLERNTILRNKLDLQINKPKQYATVNSKYQKLGDTLKKDVAMQREVLLGMKERATMNEDISDRIKKFRDYSVGAGAGAVGLAALSKFGKEAKSVLFP